MAEQVKKTRRRLVEPTPAHELRGKLIERYRDVLLSNTAFVTGKIKEWDGSKTIEIGPVVKDMSELLILAAYYRRYGYEVEARDGEGGMMLHFMPIKIEVKLDDVLPERFTEPPKAKKPAKIAKKE